MRPIHPRTLMRWAVAAGIGYAGMIVLGVVEQLL